MKTALITGGSSGIGFELSKLFAADNYRLLWVSKSKEELASGLKNLGKEYTNIEVHTLEKDLSLPNASIEVYEWSKNIAEVNVLVNNAGYGTYGFLLDIPEEKELAMINLNIVNVYLLTRYFLRDMIARNEGRIMNISSNASLQPVPLMSTYSSTKVFVKHFSQSLHDELKYKNSKVTVTAVCPPATPNTGFQEEANMNNVKTFHSFLSSTPSEVARYAFRGTMAGKELVLAGWRLRNLIWLYGVLPKVLLKYLLKNELKRSKI
jgi:short-subunit dehydrogenase